MIIPNSKVVWVRYTYTAQCRGEKEFPENWRCSSFSNNRSTHASWPKTNNHTLHKKGKCWNNENKQQSLHLVNRTIWKCVNRTQMPQLLHLCHTIFRQTDGWTDKGKSKYLYKFLNIYFIIYIKCLYKFLNVYFIIYINLMSASTNTGQPVNLYHLIWLYWWQSTM